MIFCISELSQSDDHHSVNFKLKEKYYCDPYSACKRSRPGNKVPNPLDCHSYFLCIQADKHKVIPSDNPLFCKEGYYFDPKEGKCRHELVPCYKPCINLNCLTSCPKTYKKRKSYFLPHPSDCNRYYACAPNSDPIEKVCPPDAPYFDGQGCSKDRYSCCDACLPFCQYKNTQTMDPYNCNSYYLCAHKGIPQEEYHLMCPSGTYFDPERGFCTEQDNPTCDSVCSRIDPENATTIVTAKTTDFYSTEETHFHSTEITFTSDQSTSEIVGNETEHPTQTYNPSSEFSSSQTETAVPSTMTQ